MKTLKYTEVRGQIVTGEVIAESNTSYNLKFICFDEAVTCIRVKSECFSNRRIAERYFK